MRRLMTLALVLSFFIVVPVHAADHGSVSGSAFNNAWTLMSDWFVQVWTHWIGDVEPATDSAIWDKSSGSSGSSGGVVPADDAEPITPPTTNAGPLIIIHG